MATEEDEKKDVGAIQPDAEGKVQIPADKDGKYPEVVPWHQYVGIKESLGGKLDAEKAKVSSLEEKLKNVVDPEELKKVKEELDTTKTKLTETETELSTTKEKTLTEKRDTLTKRGIPEDKVKDMSEKELDAAFVVLQHSKPSPDLGGGGGSGASLEGKPMDLARQAYASSNK